MEIPHLKLDCRRPEVAADCDLRPGFTEARVELRRLLNRLKPVAADDLAQDLAEYGIALAVIGLGAALAAIAVAGNVNEIWAAASSVIGEAI